MTKPSLALRVLAILLILTLPFWIYAGTGKRKIFLRPVNVNTATAAELQRVPGIGPKTAERILAMRRSVGRFRSVDDLLAVRGIGPKRLAKMKPYLTVETPPAAPKQPTPSAGNFSGKHSDAEATGKP